MGAPLDPRLTEAHRCELGSFRRGAARSAEDDDLSSDARKLYDALTCPKHYLQFKSAQGAGQHCEAGARTLFHQRAFDWLDQVLKPVTHAPTAATQAAETGDHLMR
jgi:hypothetical protein